MEKQRVDLIRQALTASESSIRLARTLLNDLETETSKGGGGRVHQQSKTLPGVTGIYDGESMVSESGEERYPVPENYASKSILVIGDTLKLVEEGGQKRFKQIEHVKRFKTTGILTKKEGKWAVVTPEGSYKILAASVDHFNGDSGDEALLQLPAKNLQVPWAAVEKIAPKGQLERKSPVQERIEEKSTKTQTQTQTHPSKKESEQPKPEKSFSKPETVVKDNTKVDNKKEKEKTTPKEPKEPKAVDKKSTELPKSIPNPISATQGKSKSQPSPAKVGQPAEDELS